MKKHLLMCCNIITVAVILLMGFGANEGGYASQGSNLLWSKAVANASANAVDVDSLGNIVVAGFYVNGSVVSPLLLKTDSNGNFLWKVEYAVSAQGYAVAVDSADNIYFSWAGNTSKYDSSGNLIWETAHCGSAYGAAVDSLDNVIVAASNCTAKINPNGNILWERNDTYPDQASWAVAIDAQDNIVKAGWKHVSGSSTYAVTEKLDSNGNRLWVDYFLDNRIAGNQTSSSRQEAFGVTVLSTGDIVTVGSADVYEGALRYQIGIILKYSPSGEVLRVRTKDTSSYLTCAEADANGDAYVGGSYSFSYVSKVNGNNLGSAWEEVDTDRSSQWGKTIALAVDGVITAGRSTIDGQLYISKYNF